MVDHLQSSNMINLLDTSDTIPEKRPEQHKSAQDGDDDWKEIIVHELQHADTPVIVKGRILAETRRYKRKGISENPQKQGRSQPEIDFKATLPKP